MVIAETELLGAANSIDAAAKKLANLKPRIHKTHVSILYPILFCALIKEISFRL